MSPAQCTRCCDDLWRVRWTIGFEFGPRGELRLGIQRVRGRRDALAPICAECRTVLLLDKTLTAKQREQELAAYFAIAARRLWPQY